MLETLIEASVAITAILLFAPSGVSLGRRLVKPLSKVPTYHKGYRRSLVESVTRVTTCPVVAETGSKCPFRTSHNRLEYKNLCVPVYHDQSV